MPFKQSLRIVLSGLIEREVLRQRSTGDALAFTRIGALQLALLKLFREDDPDWPGLAANVSVTFRKMWEEQPDRRFLDTAMSYARRGLARAGPGHPDRVLCLNALGLASRQLLDATGDVADINVAVRCFEELLELPPPHQGLPDDGVVHSNLGLAFRARFLATNQRADIRRAVVNLRAAVNRTGPSDFNHAMYLSNLGLALDTRFIQFGEVEDLAEAIEVTERAVSLSADRPAQRSVYQANLGRFYAHRAVVTSYPEDAVRSLDLTSAAVAGDEHALRTGRAHRLESDRLSQIYEWNLTVRDQMESELVDDLANDLGVELDPRSRRNRLLALATLAGEYPDRPPGSPSDVPRRSIGSLDDLPYSDDTDRLVMETTRSLLSPTPESDAEVAAWCDEFATSNVRPLTRIVLAQGKAETRAADGEWGQAARYLTAAVELLPALVRPGTGVVSQEEMLKEIAGLASDAAASILKAAGEGCAERALAALEQGRTVVWNQRLLVDRMIENVRRADRAAARRLVEVGQEIRELADPSRPFNGHRTDRRFELAEEWDGLTQAVESLPAAVFGAPVDLPELRAAAAGGPIVVFNVSRFGSHALVVRTDGVTSLPLPELSAAGVAAEVVKYLAAAERMDETHAALLAEQAGFARGIGDRHRVHAARQKALAARTDLHRRLAECTGWLWEAAVQPVLRELGLEVSGQGDALPRIWLCPTGLLGLLPLHAAGHYGAPDRPDVSLLDHAVCSYAPTVRTLLSARAHLRAGNDAEDSMLVVAMPETPDQPPLRSADAERTFLSTLLPGRYTVVEPPHVTRERARAELSRHRFAHFSCHGTQDLLDPSHGGLLLQDGMLTVADISEGVYQGRFAFLSACKTATGSVNLYDEANTLAAVLHLAGYEQVVGTLWSVLDDTAVTVTEGLYGRMTHHGTLSADGSARALHTVIQELRQNNPGDLLSWMPFVHVGL
ncbi:CHAT domain-containing protein [Streptomyces sp. NRRL B-24484]|uniref:CHAT domain-containing protein n=1 Tax=Streptomyces sp. NRRL B-24484 TaxID=1463833 RepID=UPI0004BEC040|nr:CHAT domain-containing protein [Streptomyces sp. NRRL B-24484]